MAIAPSTHWQGLLDLTNLAKTIADIKKGGFEKKLVGANASMVDELADFGKELYNTSVPNINGLTSYLENNVVITNLVNVLNDVNPTNLSTFRHTLKNNPSFLKDIMSNLDSYLTSPSTLNLIGKGAAFFIPAVTNINTVISSYTTINLPDLINPATSLNFLHEASLLDQTTYDYMLKTIKGTQLSSLIANLPFISAITEVTGLDAPTISSYIDNINQEAMQCICEVLNANPVIQTQLNAFFNFIIPSLDTDPAMEALKASRVGLANMINGFNTQLNGLVDNYLTPITDLITALQTLVVSIPAPCNTPVYTLIGMLSSIRGLISLLLINPLIDKLKGFQLSLNNIIDLVDLIGNIGNIKFQLTC